MKTLKIDFLDPLPICFTGIAEMPNGSKYWFLNGNQHRENGPAVELANGSKQWYLNGQRHRVDGPACEDVDGEKVWYSDDEFLFVLSIERQPFIFIEEAEDGKQIKVLTPDETEIWPNLPGLKELAENWEAIKR